MAFEPTYTIGTRIGDTYQITEATATERRESYAARTAEHMVTLDSPARRLLADRKVRDAFNQTAALWLSLDAHSNVQGCYRVETHDGVPFIIAEYVGARTLANLFKASAADSQEGAPVHPLPIKQALDLAIQICRGLAHIVKQRPGFVHRSLRPAAVSLSGSESNALQTVKIGSFWTATATPNSADDVVLEYGLGDAQSTLELMPPEAWRGEPLNGRADIYAIGGLLVYLLTGKALYTGSDVSELRQQHLSGAIPSLIQTAGIPATLDKLIAQCLAKERDSRPATAEGLRKQLTAIFEDQFGEKPSKVKRSPVMTVTDFFERGKAYNAVQSYTLALADLDQAIKLAPERADYQLQRGFTLYGLARYRDALIAFKQTLKLSPDHAEATLWAGRSLAARGDRQGALPYLEKAAQLGVPNVQADLDMARQQIAALKTNTLQLSTAVTVARANAASEARRSHFEFIEPEHLFNGLAKLEDQFVSPAIDALKLAPDAVDGFTNEVKQLLALFNSYGVSARQARRALRVLIGDNGFQSSEQNKGERSKGRHISRSLESRAVSERARVLASEANAPVVAVQHLLAALLDSDNSRIRDLLISLGVDVEGLLQAAMQLPLSAVEDVETPWLNSNGVDLTALALEGKLSDAVGRDEEILQVLRTLSREMKNNPVLVGEGGVGKTAIVEGIAYRIANRTIDKAFRNRRIVQISVAQIESGTKYRGEFEEKILGIVNEASSNPNIILFIDEMHMLAGAGRTDDSSSDAANILKPFLARGVLKLIGATTEAEYYRHIGRDPAFERRFQLIHIAEPSVDATRKILRSVRVRLEKHHNVLIREDAIDAAISLSVRYMPSRRLPDKARDLLDEAAARVRYSSAAADVPADVNDSVIDSVIVDSAILDSKVDRSGMSADNRAVLPVVTESAVREVVAEKVGVPVTHMSQDEAQRILRMGEVLSQRVIGQDQAIEAVATAIRRNYVDLRASKRPVGVFLFVGPSGVGKTELAKATANFLFGSDDRMIRLDMSEYMEAQSVSRLVGAPPGYAGFEQGGQLTEALRRTPYSVVLLDEVEKAHPDVLNIFLQAFGEGRLTDNQGNTVDASNVIFMMTSNLGAYTPSAAPSLGFQTPAPTDTANSADTSKARRGMASKTAKAAKAAAETAIRAYFRPELLNRLDDIVVFEPLTLENMPKIVRVHLKPLSESLSQRGITLVVDDAAMAWLAQHGQDNRYGARPLIRLIDREITNAIGGLLLTGRLTSGATVRVGVEADGEALSIAMD